MSVTLAVATPAQVLAAWVRWIARVERRIHHRCTQALCAHCEARQASESGQHVEAALRRLLDSPSRPCDCGVCLECRARLSLGLPIPRMERSREPDYDPDKCRHCGGFDRFWNGNQWRCRKSATEASRRWKATKRHSRFREREAG